MKIKNITVTVARLALFCMAGYLGIMDIVAENQSRGIDRFNNLKQKNPSCSAPDENSPDVQALQQKIDKWYPKIIEQYPRLKVEFKDIPDEQNGFLKILEWQEEVLLPVKEEPMKGVLFELPAEFLSRIDWDHLLANPEEIKSFLAPKQIILDRAIAIGLLPEQSAKGISPNRHLFRNISFNTKIAEYLQLKAIAEANRGDVNATLKTVKAIHGWINHFCNTETPYLMTTTISIPMRLGLQSTIHDQILPRLAKEDIDYAQWIDLTKPGQDIQQQWLSMWRGEWYVITTSKWNANILAQENLQDPIALLGASAAVFNALSDPAVLRNQDAWQIPPPPSGLSRKSRDFYKVQFENPMVNEFGKGMIRSKAILRQYELALILQKLEAEGQDLKALNEQILDSLPTRILPGIDLTIDFDKREITAPADKIYEPKTVSF